MTAPALGGGVGLLAGIGLMLVTAWSAARRAPSLADRVGPYVGDAGRLSSAGLFRRLMRSAVAQAWRLDRICGAAGGSVAGAGVAALSPGGLLPLLLAGGAVGACVPDWRARRAATARTARLLAELPTVAELLALAVAAGEEAGAALDRVTKVSRGELASELRQAVAAARAGEPLTAALDRLAQRMPAPAVARFLDGLVVAIERGTPLADVLRAQAADAREAGRRRLLETGARQEIWMLVPVVFLVLPVCVVFALFPALHGLTLVAP